MLKNKKSVPKTLTFIENVKYQTNSQLTGKNIFLAARCVTKYGLGFISCCLKHRVRGGFYRHHHTTKTKKIIVRRFAEYGLGFISCCLKYRERKLLQVSSHNKNKNWHVQVTLCTCCVWHSPYLANKTFDVWSSGPFATSKFEQKTLGAYSACLFTSHKIKIENGGFLLYINQMISQLTSQNVLIARCVSPSMLLASSVVCSTDGQDFY